MILLILKEAIFKLEAGEHSFLPSICGILEVCALPFDSRGITSSSKQIIGDFMLGLTALLQASSEYVIIAALEAIRSFSEGNSYNLTILSASGAPTEVCKAFVTHVGDECDRVEGDTDDTTSSPTASTFILRSYLEIFTYLANDHVGKIHNYYFPIIH